MTEQRMAFSPKCFARDHVARTREGLPLGRVILRKDDDLAERMGQPLEVALFNLPKQFEQTPRGLQVWIDDREYKIPSDLPQRKIRIRGDLIVVSNFVLDPVEVVDE